MRPAPIVFRPPMLSLNLRLLQDVSISTRQLVLVQDELLALGRFPPTMDDYVSVLPPSASRRLLEDNIATFRDLTGKDPDWIRQNAKREKVGK